MSGIEYINSFVSCKNTYIILYILFFIVSCSAKEIDTRCMLLDPSDVKEGTKYQDCKGIEKVGTMLSTASTETVEGKTYPLCTGSNQVDCIIGSEFKSIKVADIDPNSIKSGTNLLGVEGRLPECSSENEIDCITNTRFSSINPTSIPYEKLLSSVSILGEHGGINLCSNEQYGSCYINSDTFKAVESETLIASNIKLGVSLGGVTGTYGYNDCDSETHTGCLAVSGFPSVEPSAISSYLLNNDAVTALGLSGSIPVCVYDDEHANYVKSGCYVNGEDPNLLAINTADIVNTNIKSGVRINEVNGTLFKVSDSNTSKLSLTGEAFSDLGSGSYPAGTNLVWFDKDGVERTGSVPSSLQAKNVKDGVTVFGIDGSYEGKGKPKLYTNGYAAFAILNTDGSVISGGDGMFGGVQKYYDQSESQYVDVSSQLTSGVKEIYYTMRAFAALKEDGSVVTWGADSEGGDPSSAVGGDLNSGVVRIYSTTSAFAALKEDGSVVTWGDADNGGNFNYSDGNTTKVEENSLSSGVVEIYSTHGAFIALKSNC